jgi:hypothetical protein
MNQDIKEIYFFNKKKLILYFGQQST